jgi:hypothetical protein
MMSKIFTYLHRTSMIFFLLLTFQCQKIPYTTSDVFKSLAKINKNTTTYNSQISYYWTVGVKIISNGNCKIKSKGVCYGTSPKPTIFDHIIESESKSNSFLCKLSYAGGITTKSASALDLNKTYYARPFVTNEVGTSYGEQVSFNTNYPITIGCTYQGGIVVYILKSSDFGFDPNTTHGLITAPISYVEAEASWGCDGSDIFESSSTQIGSGLSNTVAIVNKCQDASSAAKVCNALILNGYSDWFLPSKDALIQLNLNSALLNIPNTNFYWSSTQTDKNHAWKLDNALGGITASSKQDIAKVRPFRSF